MIKQTWLLAIPAALIVALIAFALFSRMASPAASPSLQTTVLPTVTSTATPEFPTPTLPPRPSISPPAKPPPTVTPMLTWVPVPTTIPLGTPLPTPDLGPSPTPQPRPTNPVWTPIPPVVTGWTQFTGKSGFSFQYPTGWYIREDIGRHLPENILAVQIYVANTHPEKYSPRTYLIPGVMGIQLMDYSAGNVPLGGIPIAVGPQKLSGLQFVYTRDDPRIEPQFRVFERGYSIHFAAGGRQWIISGTIYPPEEGVEKYTEIFYQIIGSLRYEPK